jgi:hypothetical protein
VAAGNSLHGAKAHPLTASGDDIDLGEPLAESATLARRLAPRTCRPIGPGTRDCAPYHGLVQYLRLLGVVASPLRQGRFYRDALRDVPPAPHTRVLIAGAADYCMLALVLDAYRDRAGALEVTVIDRCPTPLELCRWYAARAGVPVTTAVAEVAQPLARAARTRRPDRDERADLGRRLRDRRRSGAAHRGVRRARARARA